MKIADPAAKAAASVELAGAWKNGAITKIGYCLPPSYPARPKRPELLRPGDMPRRRGSRRKGRIALLHAIAHIEFNAIDLAWDLITRFADQGLPLKFYDDWASVAGDEGRHFILLTDRMAQLDARYGDLAAHDGLWQAAEDTAHDFEARLAVVPMVLEARGLDVTPDMVKRLKKAGDETSANILQLILDEETIVYTSGLGGNFKAGLPVGKINNEIEDLAVEFFSDLSQLSYVKVQSIESNVD